MTARHRTTNRLGLILFLVVALTLFPSAGFGLHGRTATFGDDPVASPAEPPAPAADAPAPADEPAPSSPTEAQDQGGDQSSATSDADSSATGEKPADSHSADPAEMAEPSEDTSKSPEQAASPGSEDGAAKQEDASPKAEEPAASPTESTDAKALNAAAAPPDTNVPPAQPPAQPAAQPPVAPPAEQPAAEKPTANEPAPSPAPTAVEAAGIGTEAPVTEPPAMDKPAEAPAPQQAEAAAPSKLDLPADLEAAMDNFMGESSEPHLLRFAFRFEPWEDVLEWFAEQSDLSLVMDAPPPGTFNYTDNRDYTPAEAIDLINSVLLVKGYTLVRRDRMLMVINLEDGIPPNLVTTIPLNELDKRGEFELVGVVFQLDKFDPQEAETEIKQLIGPQGSVVALPKTRQLYVIETAGRLRTIRDVIQRVEDPQGIVTGKLESYEFKNILPDEGLVVLRQLLDIPLDANATEDDSFRFALDPMGMRLLFSGSAEKIAKAKEILEEIDKSSGNGDKTAELGSLQLEVYPIAIADPESVLKVMQTLLEGLPGVRLSIDPSTGSLIALARPSDHRTIRATIDQMQAEVRRIEVIPLQRVDPQVAAVAIKKMFGESDDKDEKKRSTAPAVEPDVAGHQLIVHGTENQIAQIKVLLGKMGETESAGGTASMGNRIRVLPITGSAAEMALQNLREIWPRISDNPIQEVNPSAMMPSLRRPETIPARVPARSAEELQDRRPARGRMPPVGIPPAGGIPELNRRPVRPAQPEEVLPAKPQEVQPEQPKAEATEDKQTSHTMPELFRFASQTAESNSPESANEPPADQPQSSDEPKTPEAPPTDQPQSSDEPKTPEAPPADQPQSSDEPKTPEAPPTDQPPSAEKEPASETPPEEKPAAPKAKSPIIISRGPNGLMIASDDVEALDEFERLLNSMTGAAEPGRTELNIFYLKYAKAEVVADTLTKIIGSGTTGSTTATEDSLLGQLVSSSVGSTLGSLLNMGASTLSPTGMLRITAEPRLNALIVEANATDLHTIEEVLKLLDQPESPEEVLVNPRARLIPVYNMAASEVAEIVKEVFADKMQGASNRNRGGGDQRPSPADFFAAMRAGRGGGDRSGGSQRGGGSTSTTAKEEPERMTVGVDARSNSLIVFASQSLYEEVQMLVEQLDMIAGEADDEATQIIPLDKYSPEAMKAALQAIMGENAVSNSSSSSSSSRGSSSSRTSSSRGGSSGQPSRGMSDDMRRRFEMMRTMMGRGGGRPGGGMPFGIRPSGGGPPGGGGPSRGGGR